MPSLVDEVQPSHANEYQLQDGVSDKHSSHDGDNGHHVVLQIDRLRLASKQSYKHIRKHGQHIAKVMGYVSNPIQPKRGEQSLPTVHIGLFWSIGSLLCWCLLR